MNKQEFLTILDKYLNGTSTKQEEELLFTWYNSFQQSEAWDESISGPEHIMQTTLLQRLQHSIQEQESMGETIYHSTPVRRLFPWRSVAAAAVVVIMLSAAAWYFLIRTRETKIVKTENIPTVEQRIAAAGHNKAMLTLGDHSVIMLDSATNGKLTQQGNTTIIKENNGQLTYKTSNEKPTEELVNTLTTPRGGQYQLVLPDGSKVWLNAASSIRYPTVFTGNERIVEVKGEAYFEVAKVPSASGGKKPFLVYISSTAGKREGIVEVLGTHFNVNAYDDEQLVKTTLLEGSVKVTKDAASAILKPGQQASLSQSSQKSHTIPVLTVDADQAISWKNGILSFKGEDIKTVMRQIARWYDVQVVYEDEVNEKFHVELNRNDDLVNVLKILETTGGAHFKMEGKKVIVTK